MTIRQLGELDPQRALEELTLKYSKLKEHNEQLQQALSYNNRIMQEMENKMSFGGSGQNIPSPGNSEEEQSKIGSLATEIVYLK